MAPSGMTPKVVLRAVPAAPACRLATAISPGRPHTGRVFSEHGAGLSPRLDV